MNNGVSVNPWHPAEPVVGILVSHTRAGCVYVLVRSHSALWDIFMLLKVVVSEELKLFLEKRFPAENVFDICFAHPSALGINEKTSFFIFFLPGIHHFCWHLPTVDGDGCRYSWHIAPGLSKWLMSTWEECINNSHTLTSVRIWDASSSDLVLICRWIICSWIYPESGQSVRDIKQKLLPRYVYTAMRRGKPSFSGRRGG